jgi:hypothetical protein
MQLASALLLQVVASHQFAAKPSLDWSAAGGKTADGSPPLAKRVEKAKSSLTAAPYLPKPLMQHGPLGSHLCWIDASLLLPARPVWADHARGAGGCACAGACCRTTPLLVLLLLSLLSLFNLFFLLNHLLHQEVGLEEVPEALGVEGAARPAASHRQELQFNNGVQAGWQWQGGRPASASSLQGSLCGYPISPRC